MTRPVLFAVALLVAASPAGAAPVPKSVKRKPVDGADIVGLWVSRPGDNHGWLFRDDGTAGVGDPANPSCKAIYKVDPTQTPKHLDWSQDGGKSWYLGIYEVDGDVLKINFGGGGSGVRPTALGPNTGFQWVTGTRQK
jgi:uncharacterized protein (TIGR03067 family)